MEENGIQRCRYEFDGIGERKNEGKEESREKGIFTGRTEYNPLVHFPGCQDLIGKYVKVKLDTCKGFYYFGSLAE